MKIKYPLNEIEKQQIRNRLEEILNKKDGEQAIILIDEKKLTDYYQNICGERMIKNITKYAKDFAKITGNKLIHFNDFQS